MESLERIKAAIADKPNGSYCVVLAADVVSVASNAADSDVICSALRDGAARALAGHDEAKNGPLKVLQLSEQLRRLVALVEAK